ncbi:MAG: tripartite tricarboxylate transporter substrate binding protein [Proteobacteria bacterium]|nr:tripartite tricarboxylate transporter substrate binding protein [Pseudomonadota bacterium]
MNLFHRLLFSLGACALAAPPVWPQNFPSHPIRFVIPFAPGGPADVSARTLAVKLTETLGQNIVIDNRPGGGGIVAAEIVARARPDGHTILLCSTSVMVINPIVTPDVPYNALRDFAPVSLVSSSPYLLLTHATFPATLVKELVAIAKAKPGTLNFGSAGIGSTSHLVAEIFRSMAGIAMTHVPYKGSALAATDLMAGQLQVLFESVSSALPNVNSGRLRALGISTLKRFALTPQVPPIAESGVPGYQAATWQGVCAPAGTPKPVLAVLNRTVVDAARAPATVQRYAALGAEAVGSTPEEFTAFVKAEIPRWTKAIRDSGARPQ